MTEKADSPKVAPARSRRRPRTIDMPPFGVTFRLKFEPGSALTDEVFKAIAAGNPDLRLERTANKELEVMAPAGGGSSNNNFRFNVQLGIWAMKEGGSLEQCFDATGGFVLPNGAIRSPDASWIRRERLDSLTVEERKKFLPFCPDFVVELVSESDRLSKARAKLQEYMENGARLGWLIDPIRKQVEIYRPGRPVESLDRPKTLSGEDVLPGFVCELEEILNA